MRNNKRTANEQKFDQAMEKAAELATFDPNGDEYAFMLASEPGFHSRAEIVYETVWELTNVSKAGAQAAFKALQEAASKYGITDNYALVNLTQDRIEETLR